MKMLIRYPHGWFPGGIWENEYAPTVTISSWEFNNYVLEIDEEDCDTEAGAERGGEAEEALVRRQGGEVQQGEDTLRRLGRCDRHGDDDGDEGLVIDGDI